MNLRSSLVWIAIIGMVVVVSGQTATDALPPPEVSSMDEEGPMDTTTTDISTDSVDATSVAFDATTELGIEDARALQEMTARSRGIRDSAAAELARLNKRALAMERSHQSKKSDLQKSLDGYKSENELAKDEEQDLLQQVEEQKAANKKIQDEGAEEQENIKDKAHRAQTHLVALQAALQAVTNELAKLAEEQKQLVDALGECMGDSSSIEDMQKRKEELLDEIGAVDDDLQNLRVQKSDLEGKIEGVKAELEKMEQEDDAWVKEIEIEQVKLDEMETMIEDAKRRLDEQESSATRVINLAERSQSRKRLEGVSLLQLRGSSSRVHKRARGGDTRPQVISHVKEMGKNVQLRDSRNKLQDELEAKQLTSADAIIQRFDEDKDGVLKKRELDAMAQQLRLSLTGANIRTLLFPSGFSPLGVCAWPTLIQTAVFCKPGSSKVAPNKRFPRSCKQALVDDLASAGARYCKQGSAGAIPSPTPAPVNPQSGEVDDAEEEVVDDMESDVVDGDDTPVVSTTTDSDEKCSGEQVKVALSEFSTKSESLQGSVQQICDKIAEVTQKISGMEVSNPEALNLLKEELQNLKQEVSQTQSQRDALQKELDELRVAAKRIQRENESELSRLQSLYNNLMDSVSQTEDELKQARDKEERLKDEIADLVSKSESCTALSDQLTKLSFSLDTIKEQQSMADNDVKDLKDEYNELVTKNNEKLSTFDDYEDELATLSGRVLAKHDELKEINSQIADKRQSALSALHSSSSRRRLGAIGG